MYLKYLRYFITVAECRNFSRAAEKLNTVQPSISRQIKRLEEIVGTQLLIRSPHELTLTKAGELFLEESKLILQQFEYAKNIALEAAMTENNKIEVGLISGTEQPFFEHVLTPAREIYPELEANLTSHNERRMVEKVKDGTLDIGFLIGPIDNPYIDSQSVCSQELAIAISANDPLNKKTKLRLEDLAGLDLYIPTEEQAPYYSAAIKNLFDNIESFPSHSNVYCDCAMSAMLSIGHSGGCCFVSTFQSNFAPDNVVIKELEIDNCKQIEYNLVVITSNKNKASSTSKVLSVLH